MPIEPKCSFRIMGLREEELSELEERYLSGLNYRKGSQYQDKNKKILRIIINENTNEVLLQNLLKDSISDVVYDFFVSISSEEQSAIVDIPEFVLNLQRSLGGKISFSYTCIPPE